MRNVVNVEQAEAWNGPEGEHWATREAHRPTDIDRFLLDASGVGPGDRILDIGCGIGDTTRAAAHRATGGHALGLDLSGPQLARARQLAAGEGVTNVTFEQGDAQAHPLPAGGFDVAVSRFGIMFFADPVAAFANVAGALRPGGRLAFVCPQGAADQPWYVEPLAGLLGEDGGGVAVPEDGSPGMFSLADSGHITDVLGAAGFADVHPAARATPMDFGPTVEGAVRFYLGSGPVRALLEDRPDLAAAAPTRLEATLARYLTPAGVRVPATHWLVTARRP
jgi:SAM-dependent methyltransferase